MVFLRDLNEIMEKAIYDHSSFSSEWFMHLFMQYPMDLEAVCLGGSIYSNMSWKHMLRENCFTPMFKVQNFLLI